MFEMKIKRSKAEQAFNIFNIILMFVLMVVTLYPLVYVLFASLSDASKLMHANIMTSSRLKRTPFNNLFIALT